VAPDDDNRTVLYEVDLEADAEIEAPFDTWLRDHIADMLQLPGFLAAEILVDESPPEGRIRRVVQYRLGDRPALDRYLQDHAPAMRQQGVARFGDRFTARRRELAHREEFIRGAVSTENCLNCGEVLTGQHCSHCGQRSRVRVLSLGALLRDLVGDVLDFDSRVWRTLRPLALRPGQVTQEFLRGRRTYYTPPFRMYLVLSLGFFLLASLGTDPGAGIRMNVDGEGGANLQFGAGEGGETAAAPAEAGDGAAGAGAPATVDPALEEQRRQLVDAIVSRMPESERARVRAELQREFAKLAPEDIEPVRRIVDDPCGEDSLKFEIGPLGDRYAPRLREACRRIVEDSQSFGRALYDNVPTMMFLFLPLIAGVMFLLYLGSGRYYVEHLLFFVHYHAFFFLGGLAILVLDRAAGWLDGTWVASALRVAETIATTLFVLYVPWYLYSAMRRVYGQGRIVTGLKFAMLGVGYLFFMVVTAIGLLVYTALTL
jgi:hypothetical protein